MVDHFKLIKIFICGLLLILSGRTISAQSTDQNFPTPITTNEILGAIKARDIGDARLTNYFYAFDGVQGDIFINVVTKNFSGDIDIFTIDGLRPLTKMVIYADVADGETGRLIYLRKPERMLLRVEGRSPGDDPATFRIKFAGSFVALAPEPKIADEPRTGTTTKDETGIKVNSVGTIIAVIPKPLPVRKSQSAKPGAPKDVESSRTESKTNENDITAANQTAVVVEAAVAQPDKTDPLPTPLIKSTGEKPKSTATRTPKQKRTPRAVKSVKKTVPSAKAEEKKADPLANIRLVIQMKDGSVIERPLSEVLKFSVNKGVLTVIAKNGNIVRYSILDVAKVTIE